MHQKQRGLSRLVAIVGGFLILMGIVMLGIAALATLGYLNIDMLLQNKYLLTFAIAIAAVGLLDTFSAIIIARW